MTCISVFVPRDVAAGGLLTHACLFMLKIDCCSIADKGFPTFPNTEVFTPDGYCFVALGGLQVVFVLCLNDFPEYDFCLMISIRWIFLGGNHSRSCIAPSRGAVWYTRCDT